jgi:hypothetical protein
MERKKTEKKDWKGIKDRTEQREEWQIEEELCLFI